MATTEPKLSDSAAARRSQSPISHGRGGAGNINSKPSAPVGANDLSTPTLKSSTYTTGRGGSGNMASNSNAEEARKAQDVQVPVHHDKEQKGTYHWGRGGEGNMMTVGKDPNGEKKEQRSGSFRDKLEGKKERSGSFKDKLEKGKEMLGLKGKEKPANGSAIADD